MNVRQFLEAKRPGRIQPGLAGPQHTTQTQRNGESGERAIANLGSGWVAPPRVVSGRRSYRFRGGDDSMMPHTVSRWKKAIAAAWMVAGLLAGAGIWAHRAEADVPAVCVALDGSPTVGTVEDLVVTLAHEGYSADETAAMIVGSVMAQCPEYLPVIERFVAAYSVPAGVNL